MICLIWIFLRIIYYLKHCIVAQLFKYIDAGNLKVDMAEFCHLGLKLKDSI